MPSVVASCVLSIPFLVFSSQISIVLFPTVSGTAASGGVKLEMLLS